jgi:hypothetical protein
MADEPATGGQASGGSSNGKGKGSASRKYTLYRQEKHEVDGEEKDVLVKVIGTSGPTPKAAAINVAKAKDLEGVFVVIADSALSEFKLEVEQKRSVKVS